MNNIRFGGESRGVASYCVLMGMAVLLSGWLAAEVLPDENPPGWMVVTEHTFPEVRVLRTFINPETDEEEDHEIAYTLRISCDWPFLVPPDDGIPATGDVTPLRHIYMGWMGHDELGNNFYADELFTVEVTGIVGPPFTVGTSSYARISGNGIGSGIGFHGTTSDGGTWATGVSDRGVKVETQARPGLQARTPSGKIMSRTADDNVRVGKNIFDATLVTELFCHGEALYGGVTGRGNYETRPYYLWEPPDVGRVVYFPVPWQRSDASGTARFIVGDGTEEIIFRDKQVPAPALYAAISASHQPYVERYFTFPEHEEFEGTIHLTVRDTNGTPVPDLQVILWGGAYYRGFLAPHIFTTDAEGRVTQKFPYDTTETATVDMTMTAYPRMDPFSLPVHTLRTANFVQIVEQPLASARPVGKWPAYLMGEVAIYTDATSYAGKRESTVVLQLYDVADPETVLHELKGPHHFKHTVEYTLVDKSRGRNRFYMPVDAASLRDTRYGVRAVFKNTDAGSRGSETVVGSWDLPENTTGLTLHVPRQDPFTFAYSVAKVGAWRDLEYGEMPSNLQYEALKQNEQYFNHIFPAHAAFEFGLHAWTMTPWFEPRWMQYERLLRGLHQSTLISKGRVARHIGLAPPGYLGASGLADVSHKRYWGSFLLDPSGILPHHALHEFLHTLGLDDVYPDWWTGLEPPSADGYDHERNLPVVNFPGEVSGHSTAIMYDWGASGYVWPTVAEYDALLTYATEPESEKNETENTRVLWIAGEVADADSLNPTAALDPVVEFHGRVDTGEPDGAVVVSLLNAARQVLSSGFVHPYETDFGDAASFAFSLPWREDIAFIRISAYDRIAAEYTLPADAPTVSFTGALPGVLAGAFDLSWHAQCPPDTSLYATLLVSDTGGDGWLPVANYIGHDESGHASLTLNAMHFPAGNAYRFKMLVSDGLRSGESVLPGVYQVEGYNPAPQLHLPLPVLEIAAVHEGAARTLPLVLRNTGRQLLAFRVDPATLPHWIALPPVEQAGSIPPGEERTVDLAVALPGAAVWTADIGVATNDPDVPLAVVPVRIEVEDPAPEPELLWLGALPKRLADYPQALGAVVQFAVYEASGREDIEARLIIFDMETEAMALDAPMERSETDGRYHLAWDTGDGVAAGAYGIRVLFEGPEGKAPGDGGADPVLVFRLYRPNTPPQFILPETYGTFVQTEQGDSIVLPYEATDAEGDPLEFEVHGTLVGHGVTLVEQGANRGELRWTADLPGTHDVFLTATDPNGAQAEALFRIRVGESVCEATRYEVELRGALNYLLLYQQELYAEPGIARVTNDCGDELTSINESMIDVLIADVVTTLNQVNTVFNAMVTEGDHLLTYVVANARGLEGRAYRNVSVLDAALVEAVVQTLLDRYDEFLEPEITEDDLDDAALDRAYDLLTQAVDAPFPGLSRMSFDAIVASVRAAAGASRVNRDTLADYLDKMPPVEGESVAEGEPVEGENEAPDETLCGGCGPEKEAIQKRFADLLLIGLTFMALAIPRALKKKD